MFSQTPAKASWQSNSEPNDSQLALARLLERRNETEQAARIYRAHIQTDPQNPLPHHRLGVLAAKQMQLDQADEHFRKALELSSADANPDLLSDIGYLHYLRHDLPEAEQVLRKALALEPNHVATMNNLGLVLGSGGRKHESIALFRKATSSEAKAWANQAYVLAQCGQFHEAEGMYLRALTLDNTLRVAAKAALQVNQRRLAEQRIAAAGPPNRPVPQTNDRQTVSHPGVKNHSVPAQQVALRDETHRQPHYLPAVNQPAEQTRSAGQILSQYADPSRADPVSLASRQPEADVGDYRQELPSGSVPGPKSNISGPSPAGRQVVREASWVNNTPMR